MEVSAPPAVYCPKCGASMKLEGVDSKTQAKLKESGYVTGARGMCSCGVTAVLAMKRMPENPTFTLMFNIYKFE